MERKNILIIGNGCAAAECIIALRESGYKEEICILADNKSQVANPMLTTYYAAGKISFENLFPYSAGGDFYKKYAAELHPDAVTVLDTREKAVLTASGLEFRYEQCLIASGASPVLPPIEGIRSKKVFTMRTVEDAILLKEALAQNPGKALVVGASMAGIKVVELLYNAGVKVVLADLAQGIFPLSAHHECAKLLEERLKQKGVGLRFGAGIKKIEETPRGLNAFFHGSADSEACDLIVMAVGVRPNIHFINRSQVETEQGIIVDPHMRTNCHELYAAGDAAQGMDLLSGRHQVIGVWANARCQGRTAGRNMAGKNECFAGNIPHNITRFMGIDFVGIGDVRHFDRMECKQDGEQFVQLFWNEDRLTGVNLIDNCLESGVLKNALIKSLLVHKTVDPGHQSLVHNKLFSSILKEVKQA